MVSAAASHGVTLYISASSTVDSPAGVFKKKSRDSRTLTACTRRAIFLSRGRRVQSAASAAKMTIDLSLHRPSHPRLGSWCKKTKEVPPGTTETRKTLMNHEWEMRRSDPGFLRREPAGSAYRPFKRNESV